MRRDCALVVHVLNFLADLAGKKERLEVVSKFHYPQGASVYQLRFHLIREDICPPLRGTKKGPSRRQLWRALIFTNINSQCINLPIY